MTELYRELTERIRGEVLDLDRVVQRAERNWQRAEKASEDQDAYVDSVALNLHSFYSGVERLFELIAKHLDHAFPSGETWHHDLLEQMAEDKPDLRPAVIGQESVAALHEFRRFRHLVRNVYTTSLAPDKMVGLVMLLPNAWTKLHAELMAFADFLEEVDRST